MEETLHLHSQFSDLAAIEAALEGFVQRGLAPDRATELRLVLEEAFTNVVKYAHTDGRDDHPVTVRLAWADAWFELELSDDGRAFDPLAPADNELHKPFGERADGLMGLPLIRALVDECAYRRAAGRNHLVLRKRVPPPL